jgi:hypothetical protein
MFENKLYFYSNKSRPDDGDLCLILYSGKIHPEFATFDAKRKLFKLPSIYKTESAADVLKLSEIDGWCVKADITAISLALK